MRRLRMIVLLSLVAGTVRAATLEGVVRNGTTGRPAAAQTVVLIKLQGGMEEVATTTTDGEGRYRFNRAEIGQQAVLVRVNYKSVNYHQNVPPGRTIADVDIFEPTATAADLLVASRAVIVQPNGATLLVGEEFEITNASKPPGAYGKEFEFAIPEGAELAQVSAWGPAGMPVVQGTINRGNNRYAVAFPMKPGQNGVRLSYQLPYSANRATVGAPSPYPATVALVIAPPTMQITGTGLQASGQREGWNVYARQAVPPNVALDVAVSGTAAPPAETSGAGGGAGEAVPGGNTGPRPMPGRLDELKWPLTIGFAALFFLGAVFLLRRPVGELRPAAASGVAPPMKEATAASSTLAEAERDVKQSLDDLKDTLFRLELRRQAGTISEEEYARERTRTEKTLRDFVRG